MSRTRIAARATMFLVLLTATVSIPAIVAMQGCSLISESKSPSAIYNDWNEGYILAVTNINAAKRRGDISQEDWDTYYNPAIQEASRVLDTMYASLDDPEQFDLATEALASLMNIIKHGATE